MKRLLNKILGGNTITPTPEAQKCLGLHFKKAQSVEWLKIENGFEAIFYIKKQEHICHIAENGVLLENRINLNPYTLPGVIKTPALEHGELMNAISIHKPNQETEYELIVRNSQLERFTMVFMANGTLVKKIKL